MNPDFSKSPDGLIPAIVQDSKTRIVLMLGFMNEEAFKKTREINKVTFFSRSKKRLWTKGEESGNFLNVDEIKLDCDSDTLLVKATPAGPACHTGADTCFNEKNISSSFLESLEEVIRNRRNASPESSYTAKLFSKGINKIAQKVGEEAVELVIEAKDNKIELFKNEAADLLFHYMVLLSAKNVDLSEILKILQERHNK